MMAKEEVELIPAPRPQRNFQMKDRKTNQKASFTKYREPSPMIEII